MGGFDIYIMDESVKRRLFELLACALFSTVVCQW